VAVFSYDANKAVVNAVVEVEYLRFGAAALGTAVFITLCLRRRALADAEA
jgi:hypothetical protein